MKKDYHLFGSLIFYSYICPIINQLINIIMKLHKFTIVAFFIWLANALYSIKLKSFRPYFWALIMFVIVLFFQSCASSGWSCKRRYVETPKEKIQKINKPLA